MSSPEDLLTPPAGAYTFRAPRGELWIWQPAPRVVVQKCVGHAPEAIARAMTQRLTSIIANASPIVIFDDWQGVTGYDSDGRLALTEWTRRQLSHIEAIHILVGSKLVAMGISVSNLVLGQPSHAYSDRLRFAEELARAIERG
ncbi:MAG: hypothetical protein IT378_07160 [Sandaracinaceae bacterium]|nr:hypothetical protein [Sandaracinaceae bacterium]